MLLPSVIMKREFLSFWIHTISQKIYCILSYIVLLLEYRLVIILNNVFYLIFMTVIDKFSEAIYDNYSIYYVISSFERVVFSDRYNTLMWASFFSAFQDLSSLSSLSSSSMSSYPSCEICFNHLEFHNFSGLYFLCIVTYVIPW